MPTPVPIIVYNSVNTMSYSENCTIRKLGTNCILNQTISF